MYWSHSLCPGGLFMYRQLLQRLISTVLHTCPTLMGTCAGGGSYGSDVSPPKRRCLRPGGISAGHTLFSTTTPGRCTCYRKHLAQSVSEFGRTTLSKKIDQAQKRAGAQRQCDGNTCLLENTCLRPIRCPWYHLFPGRRGCSPRQHWRFERQLRQKRRQRGSTHSSPNSHSAGRELVPVGRPASEASESDEDMNSMDPADRTWCQLACRAAAYIAVHTATCRITRPETSCSTPRAPGTG